MNGDCCWRRRSLNEYCYSADMRDARSGCKSLPNGKWTRSRNVTVRGQLGLIACQRAIAPYEMIGQILTVAINQQGDAIILPVAAKCGLPPLNFASEHGYAVRMIIAVFSHYHLVAIFNQLIRSIAEAKDNVRAVAQYVLTVLVFNIRAGFIKHGVIARQEAGVGRYRTLHGNVCPAGIDVLRESEV